MRTIVRNGHPGKIGMAVLLLLVAIPARPQLLDSIGLFLREPPRFVFKLDTRGSFISNENVRLMGVKVGLEHAGRVQYGVGYSFLSTPVEHEREVEGTGIVTTRLRLGLVTPYFEYAFYQRGPWEVRIPVQVGIGAGSVVYNDAEGRKQVIQRAALFSYEPAMTVQYRFLKYFGLSAGWGFRLVIHTSESLGERLTAPIYLFGFKVFLGDLWRDINHEE